MSMDDPKVKLTDTICHFCHLFSSFSTSVLFHLSSHHLHPLELHPTIVLRLFDNSVLTVSGPVDLDLI